jgi:hypothetical protein
MNCTTGRWLEVNTFLSLYYVQITAKPVIVMEIPKLHLMCSHVFIHHVIVSGEYFVM